MKTARPVAIESFGDRYYMAPPLEYSLFNGAMFTGGEEAGSSLGGEAADAAQAPGSSGLLRSNDPSDTMGKLQRDRQDSFGGGSGDGGSTAAGAPSEPLVAARDSIEARKAAYRLPQSSGVSKGSTAAISSPSSSRASSICSTPRHSPDDGPGLGSLRQAQQPGGLVGYSAASDSSPPGRHLATSPDGGAAAGTGTSDPVQPISAFFSGLSLGKLLSPFTGGGHVDRGGEAGAAAAMPAATPQPHPAQRRVHLRPPEGQGYVAPAPETSLLEQNLYGGGSGHNRGVGGSSVGSSRTPSPPIASSGAVGAPPGFVSSSGRARVLQGGAVGVGPGPPQQAQRHGCSTAVTRGGSATTPLLSRTPSPHPSAAAAAAGGMPRPMSEEREQALAQEADILAAWVEDMIVKSGGMAVVNRLDAALSLSNSRAYQVLCVRYTGLREFLSRNPGRFVFGMAEPSRELMVVLNTAVGGVGSEGITYMPPLRQPAATGHRSSGGSASSPDEDPSRPRSTNATPAVAAGPPNALNNNGCSSGGIDRLLSESASERSASSVASMSGCGAQGDHSGRPNDNNGYGSGGGGGSSSSLGMSGVGGISGPLSSSPTSSNWLEAKVAIESAEILKDAATRSLKAVELANTLRARLGTEVLALVREQHGGLLSLLERHPNLFRVDRIPKSDCVTLVCSMPLSSSSNTNSGASGSGIPTPLASPRERVCGGSSVGGGGSSGYRSGPEDGPMLTPLSEGAGLGHGQVATQGATRCLHIGNVPLIMSEEELQRCFERYGRIEGLRVVSQRGHRFAFVNYVSVEEAVRAKACLSRQNVWRSAVSFARRESFRPLRCESFESVGSGGYASDHSVGSSDGRAALAAAAAAAGQGQGGPHGAPVGRPAAASISSAYWTSLSGTGAACGAPQHFSQQQQQQQQQQQLGQPTAAHAQLQYRQQQLPQLSLFGSSLASPPPSDQTHGDAPQQQQQQQQEQQQQLMAGASSSAAASALAAIGGYGTGSLGGNGGTMSEFPAESLVMTTLTSDQFVPTQAWPANFAQDWPFVEAVVEQLRQVGGSTTVSKLRGLLKNRLGSARTVKSVPLKALLQAYGPLFVVHGNRVSLMSSAAGIGGGGMQQLSVGGHGPPPGMRLGVGMVGM